MPSISKYNSPGQKLKIHTPFEYNIRKRSFLIQFSKDINAHSVPIMFWCSSGRLFFMATFA